jgi:hypothetical protein
MWRATELETLAKMYHLALAIGEPVVLSDDEILRTVERFKTYGQGLEVEIARTAPERNASRKKKIAAGSRSAATEKGKKR